ncbi:hypothetical protein [Ornithinibacillus xuwenensis]|uniref:Uncharacterized protein n=1 Tax=Ornithinibacillus xuwenensis TaxID=3144668 RepID=A0ABU9XLC4_9BACI
MRNILIYSFVFITCLFLVACQSSDDKAEPDSSENAMNQVDIFDFKYIQQAQEATEKHAIDEVIKVFFDESSNDQPYKAVAIDVENNEIYRNPIISRRGLRAQDGVTTVENSHEVQDILKKYAVQDWKSDYTFEDAESYEDGYSWRLWLQFEDGTVEKYAGKGTDKEKLTPEKFDDFAQALYQFQKDKIAEASDEQ